MVVETLHTDAWPICTPWKTYLGAFTMICIILSVLLYIANYFINSGKPKTSRKPLLWLGSATLFALAVLSIAIYAILPSLVALLRGPDYVSTDPCDAYLFPAKDRQQDCGEKCTYNSASGKFENCTCT